MVGKDKLFNQCYNYSNICSTMHFICKIIQKKVHKVFSRRPKRKPATCCGFEVWGSIEVSLIENTSTDRVLIRSHTFWFHHTIEHGPNKQNQKVRLDENLGALLPCNVRSSIAFIDISIATSFLLTKIYIMKSLS